MQELQEFVRYILTSLKRSLYFEASGRGIGDGEAYFKY